MWFLHEARRFLALPGSERALLMRAAFCLLAARLGLALLPFRLVQRLAAAPAGTRPGQLPAERVVWAVAAMSRRLPAATCLTQALAAQRLLARHGHRSELRIGVVHGVSRRLEAHAWLEAEGRVLIGASRQRFTPLPLPGGRA